MIGQHFKRLSIMSIHISDWYTLNTQTLATPPKLTWRKYHSKFSCIKSLGFWVLFAVSIGQPTLAQYTFYEGDHGRLSAGLQVQTASLGEVNNRAGSPDRNRISDIYWELTVEPNLKGIIYLPRGSQIYSGFSLIYSAMLGYDPSFISQKGVDPNYKDRWMAEEYYIGWRSGTWLDPQCEYTVDFSLGSQDYKLGSGLLLANGTDDGGYRGSYWIGSRTVFINTLISRIKIKNIKLEGFYLENNPRNLENRKRYAGINMEYNYATQANFGFSYINDDDYSGDITARTDVYDFRFDFKPFAILLPELSISTEYVNQRNNKLTDRDSAHPDLYYYGEMGQKTVQGGFGQIEYKFVKLPGKLALSYRYAVMEKGFDYMNFGYKTWGTWFQGEISGEFIFDTTNLITHLTRLVINPTNNVTMNINYFNYTFDDPKTFNTTSANYGNEIDFVTDWSVNEYVDLSAGIETLIPSAGAQQLFGGNKMWLQMMVYASFKF